MQSPTNQVYMVSTGDTKQQVWGHWYHYTNNSYPNYYNRKIWHRMLSSFHNKIRITLPHNTKNAISIRKKKKPHHRVLSSDAKSFYMAVVDAPHGPTPTLSITPTQCDDFSRADSELMAAQDNKKASLESSQHGWKTYPLISTTNNSNIQGGASKNSMVPCRVITSLDE